jgi:glycosyltransferase involved in cell wall biosynthesis
MLERNCIGDFGNPPICVVIQTYFRTEYLVKVLDSILALNYPKELIEVILAIDPRDLRALEVIEKFKNKGIKLKLVTLDVNLADRGRNLGIMRCSSEVVAVVDDDVVLHPETVNVALRHLRDRGVVAVGFPAISASPSLGEKLHHWRFSGLKSVEVFTVMPVTFFKRSALLRVGLYREDMGPPLTIHEDWELGSRIRKQGYKVLVSGEICVKHKFSSESRDFMFDQYYRSISVRIIFKNSMKQAIHYVKAYVSKHWWSFLQVLKVSPSSQKLEYVAYYAIPLVAILLLAVNTFWFLTFLLAVLALIEVHSLARGYYRVLSVWERLAYPVILVLARIFRSYLALAGLLYNVTIRGLAYRARR